MRAPNKRVSKTLSGMTPVVMPLDDMEWFLNDNQKKMMKSLYNGTGIEVEQYIDTASDLNNMAGEYLIETIWSVDGKVDPTLTPRGVHYVEEYLLD